MHVNWKINACTLFSLSDGLSCDLSSDEELIMRQGDYKSEVFRLMKQGNKCVLQPQTKIFKILSF